MFLKNILIFLIRFYQILSSSKTPRCRYIPTCSVYMIQAIEKYGCLKGLFLGLKRILRCRPGFGKYKNCGYDPVP